MKDQRLGSWTSSGPTLLVIGGISLSGLLVEIVEWFVTQRLPQPRFANLPLLYVPLAGWLIYKAFREPPLLKCLLIALAGSLILMSLGPSWQHVLPVWILQRLLGLVSAICMLAGGWPVASRLGRTIAAATGAVVLIWPYLTGEPRRLAAFAILAALIYGIAASASLRRRHAVAVPPPVAAE